MSKEQAVAVEGMIFNNGYVVPEQNSDYEANIITNHLPGNHAIGSKKNLFRSMFAYYTAQNKDPFEYIPQTYLV